MSLVFIPDLKDIHFSTPILTKRRFQAIAMKFSVEQILNLPGIKVLSCQEIEGLGLIIEIQAASKSCTCPKCGKPSHSIHQNHWRNIQDLPWGNQAVILRINRRQFRCKNCQKPFSEDLDFVKRQRGYTKRFAQAIVEEVLNSNIRSVAQRHDLSESEIQSMLDEIASSIKIDVSEIERLGVATSLRSPYNLCSCYIPALTLRHPD